MEYFSAFPSTVDNNKELTNICLRLDFVKKIKDNASLFQLYNVQDGQRPEDIAYLAYGDANLYWIVLWVNNIVDPYTEWVMTYDQFLDYVNDKYENVNATHHYETSDESDLGEGIWVDSGTAFSAAVTNYTYEYNLNENKRKIKLINPAYIEQILREYRQELK